MDRSFRSTIEWGSCLCAQQTWLEVYENTPMISVGKPEEENVHNGLLQNPRKFWKGSGGVRQKETNKEYLKCSPRYTWSMIQVGTLKMTSLYWLVLCVNVTQSIVIRDEEASSEEMFP